MPRWRRSVAAPVIGLIGWSMALGACGDTETAGTQSAQSSSVANTAPSTRTPATPPDPATANTSRPTAATPTTPVSATSPPATSPPTVSAASGEGGPCSKGELPAVGAVELDTGAVRWVACSATETYRSMIGANDEVVVVREMHESDGYVIALDAGDGAELWRVQSPPAQRPAGPVAGSGVVVLLTGGQEDAELVGVDAVTGVERWRVPERFTVLGSSNRVIAVVRSSDPMAAEPVSGIDRETGAELWVSDVFIIEASGGVESKAISGESLIVPTDPTATALDLTSGAVLWTSTALGTPIEADDVVIGGQPLDGPDAMITAVDPATGEGSWSAPGRPAYGGYIAVGEGVVVVSAAEGPGLIAYEQDTGDERWRSESYLHAHRVADGKVISLWEDGLDARSAIDGSVLWQLSLPFGSPYMNDAITNSSVAFVAINSLPWTD